MAEVTPPGSDYFEVEEPLILLDIHQTYDPAVDVLESSRWAWALNPNRAKQYNLVLAHCKGKIVGVLRPIGQRWVRNETDYPGRWDLVARYGEPTVERLYLGKRRPPEYWQRAVVRYAHPPGVHWNEKAGKLEWSK